MDTLLRDLRFSFKLLVREKIYTLTVLFTLAVCIGANVAIFGVVNGVLLEPLPYPGADRLVTVFNSYPGAGAERASSGSVDFFQRREHVDAFEEVALVQGAGVTVGAAGEVERLDAVRVTPSFFDVVRTGAAVGRTFTETEMEADGPLVALLTDGEWRLRYAADPAVVGRTLRIDGREHEVVGVLPAGFSVMGRDDARIFLPIRFGPEDRALERWHSNNYQMLARLAPGATVEGAADQVDALNERLIEAWPIPGARQLLEDAGFRTEVVDARADLVRNVRSVLFLLWGGVAFVLLIGCVNVANLALARSQVRGAEMATRLSLGAERGALARQILTESLVTSGAGAVLGVGIGFLGVRAVSALAGDALPRAVPAVPGPETLAFAAVLALVAGLLTGAFPALHVFRDDLASVFRSESRTGTANRRTLLVRSAMVSGQVALAFLLLCGSSLMVMSFRAATSVDPGFDPEDVLTAAFSMPGADYPDSESHRLFVDELLPAVRALPGVEAAAITTQLPFSGNNSSSVILPEGHVPEPGESILSPYQTWVSPGYFEALDVGVVEGRTFDDSDRDGATRVIVIDEWLARRYWPDSSPLGRRMLWGTVPGADDVTEENYATVVGVVETVKQNDLTASEHVGAYYFPYAQYPAGSYLSLVVEARGAPLALTPALRTTLERLDPEMPLYSVRTMEARLEESLGTQRSTMVILTVFAGVALLLAVVGLYGALAYTVAQRTREMGIRIAIGSSPEGIFGLVVGQGLRVTLVGLVGGVVAAALLTRLMESFLFGVRPGDPRVMVAVALILAAVAAVAAVVPAWRATRLDPTSALQGP